jgi:hypothetical protein
MRALILLLIGGLALFGIISGLQGYALIPTADHFSPRAFGDLSAWFPLINVRSNAFLHWRIDPVIERLAGSSVSEMSESRLVLASVFVLYSGLSLLSLRLSRHKVPLLSVLGSALVCAALLSIYGYDLVLFGMLAWIPFFILCALACFHGREAFGIFFVLSLFFALRINRAANVLAPLSIFIGLSAAAFLFRALRKEQLPEDIPGKVLAANSALPPAFFRILCVIAVASFFTVSSPVLKTPSPNGQEYPWQAHVVSDDGVVGNVHPLIGPGPEVPFIDRGLVKSYTGPLSLVLLLLLVLIHRSLGTAQPIARCCFYGAGSAVLLVALDAILPENFAHLAPLAVLARTIPGSFLYPLSEVFFALALIAFSLACAAQRRGPTLILSCIFFILTPKFWLQGNLPGIRHVFEPNLTAEQEKYIISPSFRVIDTLGLWTISERERERVMNTTFAASSTVPSQVTASHSKLGNETAKMFDQNRETRWSAGRAFQQGDEWLYVKFDQPQTLSAIELAPSHFKSDFPRALTISQVDGCPDAFSEADRQKPHPKIISFSPWEGTLDYTSKGFPFYTAQTRVRAFFPQTIATQCLLIEQTGKDSRVDWSVAELRLGFETAGAVPRVTDDLEEQEQR